MSDENPKFNQPPPIEPAEPIDRVGDKKNYEPTEVIGDTLDEVKQVNVQPMPNPIGAFDVPITFSAPPAEAIDRIGTLVPHEPSGVIGDTLDELRPVSVPNSHEPSGIIGDSLDELRPVSISAPYEPNLVIGDTLDEVTQPSITFMPPPAGTPEAPAITPMSPPPPVVRDHRNTIEPQNFSYSEEVLNSKNHVEKYIDSLKERDMTLYKVLSTSGLFNYIPTISDDMPGSRAFDAELIAKNTLEIVDGLGKAGVAKFIAKQTALYAMNEYKGTKIFNGLAYWVKRMPYLNSLPLFLDLVSEEELVFIRDDKFILDREAQTIIEGKDRTKGYSPEIFYENAATFTIRGIVDSQLGGQSEDIEAKYAMMPFLTDDKRVDLSKIYLKNPTTKVYETNLATKGVPVIKTKLESSAFSHGIIPMRFEKDNDEGAVFIEKDKDSPIDDDEAYVPLSFTDLRPDPRTGAKQYKTIYFRPIISSLSEQFAPSYNTNNFFGRVDQVAIYQSTARTISLGFSLHAFSVLDLKAIYDKLHLLTSLVYPEYDKFLSFKTGPVCRMRIGDVISTNSSQGKGVSGVITGLSFDYSDSVWELKKNYKLPRSIEVTVDFLVLHDGPIGLLDGQFGKIETKQKEFSEKQKEKSFDIDFGPEHYIDTPARTGKIRKL